MEKAKKKLTMYDVIIIFISFLVSTKVFQNWDNIKEIIINFF